MTTATQPAAHSRPDATGRLIFRHSIWTRLTHWVWAAALFFLLGSGLMIFNAHPTLYVGKESGFEYDNAILRIGAEHTPDRLRGYTVIGDRKFDTTGVLGWSGEPPKAIAFPGWATIPSTYDLGTARVVHFFFAWLLAGALVLWLVAGLINRHLWRDIVPRPADLAALPGDIADHARLRFHRTRNYGPLQKLSYAAVLFVALPLMIVTGLAMSPGLNAVAPGLADLFGGRQTARLIHFVVMAFLVSFFIIHIVMVVLAGPVNELRSIITGWYHIDKQEERP